MNSPESLREFTQALIRRGLPADYARRSAEELADHHRDLVDEGRDAGLEESLATSMASKRLGDMKSLLKKSVRAYQRRHWYGHWRVASFLFGPLAMLVATWIATLYMLSIVGKVLGLLSIVVPESSQYLSPAELIVLYTIVGWFMFVVPMLILGFLGRSAIRAGLNPGWIVTSAAMLGLCTGVVRWGFREQLGLPASPESIAHPFMVMFPIGVPSFSTFATWYFGTPQQIVQLLLPIAVSIAMLWHVQKTRYADVREISTC